jgi:putative membrane protein
VAAYVERFTIVSRGTSCRCARLKTAGKTSGDQTIVLAGLAVWYTGLWSVLAIAPHDRQDWLLENILALTAVAALLLTFRQFQFSTCSYVLITAFLTLHAIGAHYTYAEVPIGFLMQRTFELARNPFDRIVHFSYGLLLILPMRELLMRLGGVRGFWSYYLPISGTVAQSGVFEMIEALVATVVNPELGTAYLGTQGDEWDAQKDMAAASGGAVITVLILLFARWRDGSVTQRNRDLSSL